MKIKKITYLLLFLFGCYIPALAQVDTTTVDSVEVDSSLIKAVPDTTELDTLAMQQREEDRVKVIEIVPWEFHAPLLTEETATDSTLRWQNWPDWTYKLNREPGVISYRLGTSLRSNAVQLHAHEPRHQQLYWEDVKLNDPVTGALFWGLIPQHKIGSFYEQDLGAEYRSTYFLRQYYLNKPLSRLLYSESKFSTRSLDFEVSHNLSQKTNIELSYWDRRDGGEYSNSGITGRQIFGRFTHHLDQRRMVKLNYTNDKYTIGQPFGYVIPDMLLFNYDRYNTTANQSSASSVTNASLLKLNFYQRKADTASARDDLHAGIYFKGRERSLTYTADTTRYKTQSVGGGIRKWFDVGALELEGATGYEYFFNRNGQTGNLPTGNWGIFRAESKASLSFLGAIRLGGVAEFLSRSDGYQSYRINIAPEFNFGPLMLKPGASVGTVMPTPQQLYWQSNEYSGNANLENEKINEVRGTIRIRFTPNLYLGIRGQHKDIKQGIMVGQADSTFTNISPYASQSVTAFFDLNSTHFEFNGSATVHRYAENYEEPGTAIPMSAEERIWLKGSLYWKGYLFNRATYVKAGLSGMITPLRYQADSYNPVLDYWQPISNDQFLPQFDRLDVDITARVRSIIFVLRWENVLDEVSQLGFFETARYPMSQRRFIFGVKALFRN